ncbi:MAG: hypothetical protein MUE50_01430 [Pirellulaceae bacterium]|nr:hypothetical protein [Pirellulaceae bacterium]
MEIDPRKTYAVISGDIVRSSRLEREAREELPHILKQAATALREFLGEAIPLDIDIYAGDSWQLLLSSPGAALRAAVFLRAYLLDRADGVDTRVAVAVGSIDFVPGERVSEGDGDAFRLSGRLLQESDPGRRMWFASSQLPDAGLWDVAFGLIDAIISQSWSAKQARAVSGALRGWPLSKTAALWTPRISDPTVAGHLRKAGWPAVERTIECFEQDNNPR